MHNLFSHTPEPDYVSPREADPCEQSVIIDVPVDQAFDGFSDSVHLWWPVAEQSVFGEGSHVAILRDHLVEESEDGDEVIWAEIQEWDSPGLIRFHWTLGDENLGSNDVDVKFETANESMTRVTISWEQVLDQQSDSENAFTCDWSLILSRYARFMGGAVHLD
ncbi:hypothetical protein AS189_14690 [Arthrobacter alpinus]|uniref:ATPase n=1 Tax=Arthrobacter alpinus TaxID=656366 RepID=A0A0S2M1F3_9MICC|nr:SRPBCC domain-containing protein [Arthrobacter alpinus]ALO67508.1 hypothetical protein AS189_14690 [Arthrobacter alpinus]